MNILLEIYLSVINIIYWLYEMSIYISVNIIYSYELEEQQDQIYKEVIGYCNNFCNEISYDIVWKYCEAITITKTLYRKNIVPNFHYLTTDYFRYPIVLIKDGKEEILSQKIIALCRCGESSNKPFCDGAHKKCEFKGEVVEVEAK